MGALNPAAARLAQRLHALLVQYGAIASATLDSKIAHCVLQIEEAVRDTATDSKSLSPLDVVRIRLSKFAATLTPPALFRDPPELARLRAEIHEMAMEFVGDAGSEGSRFPKLAPK